MKYQIRMLLKNENDYHYLRKRMEKLGFVVLRANMVTREIKDITEVEIIDYETGDVSIRDISDMPAGDPAFTCYDCWYNGDDDFFINKIVAIMSVYRDVIYSYVINYAHDEKWRI